MNIAILLDISKKSGLGHVKRMMGLSRELQRQGSKCYFIINDLALTTLKNLIRKRINFIKIKNYKFKNILNIIKIKKISTVIFDTYNQRFLEYEKKLKEEKIKVIAIDDKLYKHHADIVFTNREFITKNINTYNNICFNGFKYALTSQIKKKFKTKKKNNKNIKILFHSGGNEDYNFYETFLKFTLSYFENKNNIIISFLKLTHKTEKFIKFIKKKYELKKNYFYLKSKNNITEQLRSYDIVCGPLGTTTFEIILAGAFPFSYTRGNVKEDPFSSWLHNGHLINLKKQETFDKETVIKTWDYTLNNFNKLKRFLLTKSSKLDGKANKRVAKIISKKFNNIYLPSKSFKIKKIAIKKCEFSDMRDFLELRNKSNNKDMSVSKKKIIWPDHIKWFLDKKIKKFKLVDYNYPQIFFWYKIIQDNFGKLILSGIILKNKNKLKYIGYALKKLDLLVKKNMQNAVWIVLNKKNNLIFERFNTIMGFKKIKKNNLKRLKLITNVDTKNFTISEQTI